NPRLFRRPAEDRWLTGHPPRSGATPGPLTGREMGTRIRPREGRPALARPDGCWNAAQYRFRGAGIRAAAGPLLRRWQARRATGTSARRNQGLRRRLPECAGSRFLATAPGVGAYVP